MDLLSTSITSGAMLPFVLIVEVLAMVVWVVSVCLKPLMILKAVDVSM